MKKTEQDYKEVLKKASDHIRELLSEIDSLKHKEPIAIIGMACRFPGGANTPEAFWKLLENGGDAVTEIPSHRWDPDKYYDPDPDAPCKMYTKAGAFIDGIENFDSHFFGISPKELVSMDPQHRLLLEVSWESLENAGVAVSSLEGTNTSVFVGILNSDYSKSHLASGDLTKIDPYSVTGVTSCIAGGRISYLYCLEGPNMTIHTACSSSLVSVHLACQALRNGESDLALAGGVNLILTPEAYIGLCKLNALCPDGRCKAFDASADGFPRGEGCGMIVLKRLSDALKDGDTVLAVIKGSAVNQDGKSNGMTAPNGASQQKVIASALDQARITPDAVTYVEAHGTGTPLGDPVEMRAIGRIYGKNRDQNNRLFVGSVKANIGHLESAASIAGIIKSVLAISNKKIPPQLHFRTPNPEIPWDDFPVAIPTELTPWTEETRIAGISSFGFSGTNAHIIIGEAPVTEYKQPEFERPLHILPISAKSKAAHDVLAAQYTDCLEAAEKDSSISIGDICSSACAGRSHFHYRSCVTGATKEEMRKNLSQTNSPLEGQGGVRGEYTLNLKIVFLFTGQGSQYPKMGWDLYETQPVFRKILDQCDELLRPHMAGVSLLDILYHSDKGDNRIHEARYTHPAIFSVEYALARLWMSWGIRPSAVFGHSIGEYVAACIAGVFSLEHGLKFIAKRGQLIGSLPENGAMAAVVGSKERVSRVLEDYKERISLAAINAPENMLISGERPAVEEVMEIFMAQDIPARFMQISHAVHSMMMEPIQDPLYEAASEIQFSSPSIPVISNISGKPAGPEIASPGYWRRHIREQVRFYDAMQTLDTSGYEIFLEVGTTSTLISLGMQCIPHNKGLWIPTLGVNNAMFNMNPGRPEGYNDWKPMLYALGQLYVNGIDVDWQAFDKPYPCKKAVLPNYPFQRDRYWMPPLYDTIKHENSNQACSQAEATKKSPPEGEYMSATGNYQPVTSIRQPASGNQHPATGILQPVTGNRQPATGNQQSATSNSATGNRQPATGNKQQAASSKQQTRVRIVAQQLQLMAEQLELLEQMN